jgi:uncharacterized protein (DUF1800 family)
MKLKLSFYLMRHTALGAVLSSALLLAACGGGGGGSSGGVTPPNSAPPIVDPGVGVPPPVNEPPPTSGPPPVDVPKAITRLEAARFLTQASFGASQESIDELMNTFGGDYAAWIDAQLAKGPSAPTFAVHGQSGNQELFNLFWRHAVYGDDQLRQRMAFALSQIFVTSAERAFFPEAWRSAASTSYYSMLTDNAFGNYRKTIEDVTRHPYMGLYLGTLKNRKESDDGTTIPDQNYARELMQLFAIGLHQLNADGTIKRDANNSPLPSYNNEDIAGLSRVFTGWNWDVNSFGGDCGLSEACNNRPMQGFQSFHSTLEKKFIGKTIPAGTNITESLKQALDHIGAHPNVAPFISRRLIQQFVTSNPSREYVGRVSKVFTTSSGNLGQVIKAVLLDAEARDQAYASRTEGFGKLREPVIRLTNWMRAFELVKPNGDLLGKTADNFSFASKRSELCQYPMSSPSVFNFWRPGYVPNKTFADKGLVAPEMQVVHEVCAANYLQMMKAVIGGDKDNGSTNGILSFGLTSGATGAVVIRSSYRNELALSSTALVTRMNELLAAGRMPQELQDKVKSAADSVAGDTDAARLKRAKIAAFLTMASPEYLVQK